MLKKTVLTIAVFVGAAGSLPAMAEGLYIGGSVGKPHFDADSLNGTTGGNSGVGLKYYGGYQLTPNVAVELGGTRLGDKGDAHASGAYLDAVGLYPFANNWAVLGRIGVANIKTTAGGDSDRNWGPKVGLGLQYSLTKTTSVRAEWERYRIDAFSDKSNVDQYTVGVNVSF